MTKENSNRTNITKRAKLGDKNKSSPKNQKKLCLRGEQGKTPNTNKAFKKGTFTKNSFKRQCMNLHLNMKSVPHNVRVSNAV